MKVANFTIPTDDEEVFQEFDKWVSEHPDLFPTKSRNGGRRSAAIVGLMRFVVEHPGAFAKMYAHEIGQLESRHKQKAPCFCSRKHNKGQRIKP